MFSGVFLSEYTSERETPKVNRLKVKSFQLFEFKELVANICQTKKKLKRLEPEGIIDGVFKRSGTLCIDCYPMCVNQTSGRFRSVEQGMDFHWLTGSWSA